jgi:hypothetical protein
MFQITLVSNKHNDNVGVCVVAQFFEPASDVDIGGVFGDIVYQECADGSAVVPIKGATVSNSINMLIISEDKGLVSAQPSANIGDVYAGLTQR